MRNISKIMTVAVCLGVLTIASSANAQSTQKKADKMTAKPMATKAMPAKAMASETMSRAFTNGYNVPSTGVALEGYCPVCYIAANKANKGTPEIAHDYKGVTYWFVSDGARQTFIANPEKYLPAYGGWCAVGAAMGQRFPVDPTNFKVVNGRIMLFLKNAKIDGLELWNKSEAEMLTKADENWKKLGS